MARYLFTSHDGYGLGHTRRNLLIARALLDADPAAHARVMTGVRGASEWASTSRMRVVAVPSLVKDQHGVYQSVGRSFEAAVDERARRFAREVRAFDPDVIVVDRHPYGIAGELGPGLEEARRRGIRVVLGLRDILDEPSVVRTELAGRGWDRFERYFDEVLVYGSAHLCNHVTEYGLPIAPRYCGWVTDKVRPAPRDPDLLLIAAGGGGDGDDVFRLGLGLLRIRPRLRGIIAAGPYADAQRITTASAAAAGRATLLRGVTSAAPLYRRAGAAIQMAGYNSTFEALAAGVRAIVVPRRRPRREQAIRATRLAALGLVDVVDAGVDPDEIGWLLDRPAAISEWAVREAGIDLNGAESAARRLGELGAARESSWMKQGGAA